MTSERWHVGDVLEQFQALKEVAASTREALEQVLVEEWKYRVRSRSALQMREALKYLEEVREGFALSVRAEAVHDPRELAYLVNQLLMDWGWLADMGIEVGLPEMVERVGRQLIAYAMASLALALMPELPPEAVTFPLREYFPTTTYADIPVPRTPGEVWERLEEVERVVYTAGVRPTWSLHISPLRRAYAFFEANAWLAEQQLGRFFGAAS